MASTLSENGEPAEEFSQPSGAADDLKMNGGINGTMDCEEPMDVDDSPIKHVKNPSSSDVISLSDTDNNCDLESNKETNLVSENCIASPNTAVNSRVPELEEASSNGFREEDNADRRESENQQVKIDEAVDNNTVETNKSQDDNSEKEVDKEDSLDKEEEKEANSEKEKEDNSDKKEEKEVVSEKEEQKEESKKEKVEVEDEEEDVVLMEDELADPLVTDLNPLDECSEQGKLASITESVSLDDSSGPEHEEDPLTTENDQNDTMETENNEELENEKKENTVLDKTNEENVSTNENETTQSTEENQDDCDSKEKDETDKIEKMDVGEDENKNDSLEKSKIEDENEKTPDGKGKKKKTPQQPVTITPRRSSRNVQKPKMYVDEPDIKGISPPARKVADDPDVEEIVPQDPLAMDSPILEKKNKKTVVVNDPKRLVEIASGNKQSKPGKKEPTLVIIDTNSILSGRGPVPVTPSTSITQTGMAGPSRTQAYSVLPMALPAQGMYPQAISRQPQLKSMVISQSSTPSPPIAPKPPVILPSLTDDMYVVEAPSFIVPYVYEKPPIKPLKGFVEQVEQAIKEIKAQLEKEKEIEDKKNEELEKKLEEKEEQIEEKILEEKKEQKDDVNDEKSVSKDVKSDSNGEESDKKEKELDENDKNKEKQDTADADFEKVGEKEVKKQDDVKEEKMDVDSETPKDAKDEVTSSDKVKVETKEAEKSTSTKPTDSKLAESEKSEKSSEEVKPEEGEKKKSNSYFDNPLGKFFIQIGVNLVQEHVQTDLLRSQKRKKERDGSKCTPEVQQAMNSLIRSLEFSRETNEPFKLELKKCEFCSFKTESALVMAHHLETPHMRNYVYRCNFCPLEVRSPHDILYHMEAEHNVRGRLERAPAFHQCPSCPFEDNQKGKLSRHLLSCAKKYRPERNQEPPLDFEPPAKIPRVSRNRPAMSPGTAVYQAAMSGLKNPSPHPLLPKLVPTPSPPGLIRGRGRPQMMNRYLGDMRATSALAAQQKALAQMRPGMLYRPSGSNAQPQVLLPTSYQLAGTQLYQVANHNRGLISASPLTIPSQNAAAVAAAASAASKASVSQSPTAKLLQQPSISITPLPRPTPPAPAPNAVPAVNKPGRPAGTSKATFVICEICDGYIKDLEQLRNHMQWIHKVKIHPKMIYNRPPLNCQKCQFRFFTDQGLERHLLGSHGLVTSSMQEAANKGKDGGRCPVCGRVYQWKLLNHVARDHNMSLKPAHLSYKCTVCTATFGMYKQFENHVYSAHSVVAKRVMDKKPSTSAQPSTSSQGDMLKPLKINDEITIIPQPARAKTKPSGPNRNPQKKV